MGDTVPVVMKTYAHLYPNKQAELVSKLEDLAAPENEDSGYLGSLWYHPTVRQQHLIFDNVTVIS